MNTNQAFKMSVKSILANKVRSFLTMLGIIIGVAAVIVLVSLVSGMQRQMQEYYASLGTNKINVSVYTWGSPDITSDLYDYCLSLDNLVTGVTPNSTYWGTVKYLTKTVTDAQVYLGSDQYSVCSNYQLASGRDLSYMDVLKYKKVCVIGSKVKESLFNYADPVGKTIVIGGNSFKVVGVYASKGTSWGDWMDNMIVVPYTLNRLLNKTTQMTEFVVKAKSADATTEAITRLNGFLSTRVDSNTGYYNVYSENTWQEQGNQQTMMLSLVLGGIAGISLLVGGIGIMNIMLVTVTERTREIGIRKAIGAERRAIITQFLIESSVISAMGGVIGIVVGTLLTLVLGKVLMQIVLFPSLAMTIGAFLFSVVIGVGFGLYPAVKASALQPVEALRAE
ncbi:ABC transporter permease [Papillibacter cinnamivorans]|uniref:Putative ABC transport system permease protein n=1 Tax=Papillibacter cinnamivorans DSM 12816 TaxID=1122930 RepID=A0A1W2AGU3_9FIRM|nr:ABC transporter permease [Papillibacter cinnamivorans]SMC59800.1 putative ABC transport system permease protein [Papillibacter cinnamivorans DSM 12816]